MERTLHFTGWLLFLLCAVLFLASGLSNQDPWSVTASVVFGLAVVLFLVPFFYRQRR